MPTFLLTELIEYLNEPASVVDLGSGNTAMSGQLAVAAVTSTAPFQPISLMVTMVLPPLFRIVNVSSLTEMRQALLSTGLCSGTGVAATGAGLVEREEVDGVCSSVGVRAVDSTTGGSGVGVGVSVGVATEAV